MEKSKFSSLGFILAAAGSAVGLGNIWKFPYMAGQNGGASFIVVYIICAIFVGISVMVMEFIIGRGKDPDDGVMNAYKKTGDGKALYGFTGFIGGLAPLLLLSFYMVIMAWIFKYFWISITGDLPVGAEASSAYFNATATGDVGVGIFCYALVVVANYLIVSRGLIEGIEKVSTYFMFALFAILIGMVGYAMTFDGFGKALTYMFSFDWSKINSQVVLDAAGQAFFTLSLGMCIMVTYSMSMKKSQNFVSSAIQITILDTLVAIFAGIIIFTFMFEFGAKPTAGPGLIFVVLHSIFQTMGAAGTIVATLFFLLLIFAAITSSISLLEAATSFFQSFGMKKRKALNYVTAICVVIGLIAFLSMNPNYASALTLFGMNAFDFIDFIVEKMIFEVVTFFGAVLVGWYMSKDVVKSKFENFVSDGVFEAWYIIIKYLIPIFSLYLLVTAFI